MSETLQEVIATLETIEKEELLDDPEIRDWIKKIVSDEFGLVDILVKTFLENLNDCKIIRDILKVIR
jgi:hypothetical protein